VFPVIDDDKQTPSQKSYKLTNIVKNTGDQKQHLIGRRCDDVTV